MGWWSEQAVPRITHRALGTPAVAAVRARALAAATGEVLELGFGSGANLPVYPEAVTAVAAVDPSAVAWSLAGPRIAAAGVPVRPVALDGDVLGAADDSADTVVSTFTLCTVPDPLATLAELRRVLRPGGRFLFLEHGRSPEPSRARRQRRLTPVQRRVFAGCRLDREVPDLVRAGGFVLDRLVHERLRGGGALAYLSVGSAHPG